MNQDGEDYLQWLADAPKGVRWDRAQGMWEKYQLNRRLQAAAVAKRLLGKPQTWQECPNCFGWGRKNGRTGRETCKMCFGEGKLDVYQLEPNTAQAAQGRDTNGFQASHPGMFPVRKTEGEARGQTTLRGR